MSSPHHRNDPVVETSSGAKAYDAHDDEHFFEYPVAKMFTFTHSHGYDVELLKNTFPELVSTDCENEIKRVVNVIQKLLKNSPHTRSYNTIVQLTGCKTLPDPYVVVSIEK